MYTPDPEFITRQIIERIPEKFLVGLHVIEFHDQSHDPILIYSPHDTSSDTPRIDVYMGGFTSTRTYSVLHFNEVFLDAIVTHGITTLQPTSSDPDIVALKEGHFPSYEWMFLGRWTACILPLFKLGRYLWTRRGTASLGALLYRIASWWSTHSSAPRWIQKGIALYVFFQGDTLYQREQYQKLFHMTKPVADYEFEFPPFIGTCQYRVGLLYFYGYGVPQNTTLAYTYFNKARDSGDPNAQQFVSTHWETPA
jgi:hypothetical protein